MRRTVEFYNLDAVIAVGYRVNSYEQRSSASRPRRAARSSSPRLCARQGRLEQGPTVFGKDYFDGLLETIREIRASERRSTEGHRHLRHRRRLRPERAITRDCFASVQNKLHWAITGQTAAERIIGTADADKPHMGLTTWKHAPRGKVMKSDVSVAKNYLNEEELRELEEIVSAYLDLAENRARRGILMKMSDWAAFLNQVLELQAYPVLTDKGRVSALEAKLKAEAEYDVFRVRQDREFTSDFDRVVEEAKQLGEGSKPKSSRARRRGDQVMSGFHRVHRRASHPRVVRGARLRRGRGALHRPRRTRRGAKDLRRRGA